MSQVVVPDIGDFKEVEVIEVLVKPGDAVAKEQSLITLESDKATMEIPSPSDGVVKEIKIKTGDKVSKGSPILVLDESKREEKKPFALGEVTDYEIQGDRATAKAGDETVEFVKVDGRWYFAPSKNKAPASP